ncbi:cell division protein ZapA [Natronospora cellulosivora (SeqCode)]
MAIEDKHNNRFSIKIMGEELVVVGNLSDDYVNRLSEHINLIGDEISRAYPRLSRQRIIALTIMNITDEYYKLKSVYNKKLEDLKMAEKENLLLKEKYKEIKKDYEELLKLIEEDD